jgi:hypothetical protein
LEPYVQPIDIEQATPEQLDALKVTTSNRKISDYVLVLAQGGGNDGRARVALQQH